MELFHQVIVAREFFFSIFDESDLRRVADAFLCFEIIFGIVAGAEALQDLYKQRIILVCLADIDLLPVHEPSDNGHSVLCEGTGLVGADDINRAERFHCVDLFYNGVPLAHFFDAGGEDDRYHRCEAFGNYRYRKGDGDHEGLDHIGLVDRDLADKHQYAEDDAGDSKNHRDLVQVFLQRRFFLLYGVQHAGDLADLGLVADVLHRAFAPAVFHQGGHICFILAVGQRSLVGARLVRVFFDRNGLTCQG